MIDWLWNNLHWIILAFVFHGVVLGTVAYLILLERKVASWVQDRIGPNRVGLGGLAPLVLLPLAPFVNIDKFVDRARGWKMFGFGQPLADGLKFIVKEDYQPKGVDRVLFTVAPIVMIIVIIISIAVVPWGGDKAVVRTDTIEVVGAPGDTTITKQIRAALPGVPDPYFVDLKTEQSPSDPTRTIAHVSYVTGSWPFQIAKLNIGVLYILAVLSLAVYGVVIGGWASNNKYSFLGGLRATANMISYEIPLGLSVLAVVLMVGTLDLGEIVDKQAHYWLGVIPAWNVFAQPLGFLLFLICIHAEANRAPFDLAEAEQELVGGYHTEYSSMRFALFFLAEYAGMITTSAVCVALFFGGWHLPWVEYLWPALRGNVDPNHPALTTSVIACIVRAVVFFTKTLVIVFVFMWTRWSLPRFRFDQLMMLAWRGLIPISLGLMMATGVVVYLTRHIARPGENALLGVMGWLSGWEALALLVANVAVTVLAFVVSQLVPPPPETNRKVSVPNSRFRVTPVPGGPVRAPVLNAAAAGALAVDPVPAVSGRMGN